MNPDTRTHPDGIIDLEDLLELAYAFLAEGRRHQANASSSAAHASLIGQGMEHVASAIIHEITGLDAFTWDQDDRGAIGGAVTHEVRRRLSIKRTDELDARRRANTPPVELDPELVAHILGEEPAS